MSQYLEINGVKFKKSLASYRDGGRCVGVGKNNDRVCVINTNTQTHVVDFSYEEWLAFVEGVKLGEFDLNAF